jgi:hypothetical protein
MANIKISDLTAASAAADANEFEINEAGTSKKVTGSQLKAYVNSGDGALAAKDTVATADIDNLAVTTGKLAADAVDGTKIADDAIGNEHIATGAVNADSIAADAVGADELNVTGNGTAGQYLASDADGSMTWTDLPAGGGFSNMQVFTSSGTWTNPGSVEKVKVTVVGGGGASPTTPSSTIKSGGGGGGAAIEVISFPSATNVPVTVGGNAGTSSFGGYCSATGGSNSSNGNATAGGNGSGGNINIKGSRSEACRVESEQASPYSPVQYKVYGGTRGGGSIMGDGATKPTHNGSDGLAGEVYGGGASANKGTPTKLGKPGVVIVEY